MRYKLTIVLIVVSLICGCDAINRSNLNKLTVGMGEGQVIAIMGQPYLKEASNQTEYWFYQTEVRRGCLSPFNVAIYSTELRSRYLTPVAFQNGKLIGWGKNYWVEADVIDSLKVNRSDVKIDKTIRHIETE